MRELAEPVFANIDYQKIRPKGWLEKQLRIQAEGLSGHLHEFWPDIADSQWIGGAADSWERVPYWLDGYIPLAYLLQDKKMIDTVLFYVNRIIENQHADGFICPPSIKERGRYDVWSVFLILKVLVQFFEWTGDKRAETCVYRGLKALNEHLDSHTLFNWGLLRWFECLIPLWWLFRRNPEAWMEELYLKLAAQGFDWKGLFRSWPCREPKRKWGWDNHVVNNAMAVKSGLLNWLYTRTAEDREAPEHMYKTLMEYHGMVTGVFTGDECLAGISPVQGTELCSVVELMYSFEELLLLTGDPVWGDRLEGAAFNALPAAFSPDMWTHQYDQQVNQVQCSRQENPVFLTNNGEANLFGLEPHFGCCTANLSQGWPKLALRTFLADKDGLVSSVLAPSLMETDYKGTKVSIELITDYPFREELIYIIRTGKPVEFTFSIRIPEWAEDALVRWKGSAARPRAGQFYRIKNTWKGITEIKVILPMKPKLEKRPKDLYALKRGPLVYALPIKERWERTNEDIPGREFPHCDYEVYPESDWNYGLALDAAETVSGFRFEEKPLGDCPFSPEGAPVTAYVSAGKVAWTMRDGVCAREPDNTKALGEIKEIRLIPYGCTNLRVTEMPRLT